MDSLAPPEVNLQTGVDVIMGDLELSAVDLGRRDAEAQGLCYDMTERLKLLQEEKIKLMSDLSELSGRRPISPSPSTSSARFVAAETAAAAMTVAGIVGAFAGRAAVELLAARRKRRLHDEAKNQGDT
ncbi:unnamed protein product [Hapterophycus canaliculatus]